MNVGCSDEFLAFMKQDNILAGTKLDEKRILVCATELNDKDEIEKYVAAAKKLSLQLLA